MMLRRLYESPFVRFAVVGGVATAVNYAVYVVLVRCTGDKTKCIKEEQLQKDR